MPRPDTPDGRAAKVEDDRRWHLRRREIVRTDRLPLSETDLGALLKKRGELHAHYSIISGMKIWRIIIDETTARTVCGTNRCYREPL